MAEPEPRPAGPAEHRPRPVRLAPLLRPRRSLASSLLVIALPIVAAGAALSGGWRSGWLGPGAHGAPRVQATGQTVEVPFRLCFQDESWEPPNPARMAAHLKARARYQGVDMATVPPERVHVETGPVRSTRAFGDFIQLSGLWATPAASSARGCPSDFGHAIELWGLEVHFETFQAHGADLTAVAQRQPLGIEVARVIPPPSVHVLRVLDTHGRELAAAMPLGR